MPGTRIFQAEVTKISEHGFSLHVSGEELHLSFSDFPWFKSATKEQLCKVQQLSADHLYWPLIDVDISVSSIRDPAAFPLVSVTRS